jgi:predicted ester cyclase
MTLRTPGDWRFAGSTKYGTNAKLKRSSNYSARTHSVTRKGNVDIVGPEQFAKFHRVFLETLPDMKVEILDTIAEDGKVCVHWHIKGTHTGEGLGLTPTGNEIRMRGMTWLLIKEGKITEGWDSWNQQALMDILSGQPAKDRNA